MPKLYKLKKIKKYIKAKIFISKIDKKAKVAGLFLGGGLPYKMKQSQHDFVREMY